MTVHNKGQNQVIRLIILFFIFCIMQKDSNATSSVPFLFLDDKKKMKLFPLLLIHKEAPNPDNPVQTAVPCASSEIEFPVKKWVHVGCEVLVRTRHYVFIHYGYV